jgi:hypothetical protein
MDRHDVRMRESGYGTRLAVKACHCVGIGGQPLRQDLDRDISAEPGIPRSIHLTHAAGTKGGDNLIGAEARSWGKGHGSMRDYRTAAPEFRERGFVGVPTGAGQVHKRLDPLGGKRRRACGVTSRSDSRLGSDSGSTLLP